LPDSDSGLGASDGPVPREEPGLRTVLAPLSAMTAVQAVVSVAAITVAVLAVPVSRDIGVDARLVGTFTSILFLVAVIAAAVGGGLVGRFGGVRVNQVCVLFSVIGLGLILTAWLPLVALAAVAFGCSLGPSTPASTHILARRTPSNLLALVLSIKQTGGSFGHFVAGITIPPLVLLVGWQGGVIAVALVCVALIFALQPLRRRYDDDAGAPGGGARRGRDILAGLKLVFSESYLRLLTISAFVYCATQVALTFYFVIFLTEQAGFDLITAGRGLSVATISGVIARMTLAFVTDKGWIAPRIMLALIGISMLAACLMLYAVTSAWHPALVYLVAFYVGASTMTWSGILLAEMVRSLPEGQVSLATGGTFSFMFMGAVVGPALFGALVSATGSYAAGLVTLGVAPFVFGVLILVLRPRAKTAIGAE